MVICQECQQRSATLHFTKILNGEKTEVHLCDKCSQEKGGQFFGSGHSSFSINDLLAGLLNVESGVTPAKKDTFPSQEILRCPSCQMSYPQFARTGRFGCSDCYPAFQAQLEPILKRLHSGNSTHIGKIPIRTGGNLVLRKQIDDLQKQLKRCIQKQEFEQAAELRDEIRRLEKETMRSDERSDSF